MIRAFRSSKCSWICMVVAFPSIRTRLQWLQQWKSRLFTVFSSRSQFGHNEQSERFPVSQQAAFSRKDRERSALTLCFGISHHAGSVCQHSSPGSGESGKVRANRIVSEGRTLPSLSPEFYETPPPPKKKEENHVFVSWLCVLPQPVKQDRLRPGPRSHLPGLLAGGNVVLRFVCAELKSVFHAYLSQNRKVCNNFCIKRMLAKPRDFCSITRMKVEQNVVPGLRANLLIWSLSGPSKNHIPTRQKAVLAGGNVVPNILGLQHAFVVWS